MVALDSQLTIDAPLPLIRQILLEPAQLADWNPAFLSIRGPRHAVTGQRYPIIIRGGLTGYYQYQRIADDWIEGHWQVPGLYENHVWELKPAGPATVVTHCFEHRGALAALLRPAFRGVADLRLGRLADRAEGRAPCRAA